MLGIQFITSCLIEVRKNIPGLDDGLGITEFLRPRFTLLQKPGTYAPLLIFRKNNHAADHHISLLCGVETAGGHRTGLIQKDDIDGICFIMLNPAFSCECEDGLIAEISKYEGELYNAVIHLKELLGSVPDSDALTYAQYYRDNIIPAMEKVRKPADELELLVSRDYWPFPTYGDLLFSVD